MRWSSVTYHGCRSDAGHRSDVGRRRGIWKREETRRSAPSMRRSEVTYHHRREIRRRERYIDGHCERNVQNRLIIVFSDGTIMILASIVLLPSIKLKRKEEIWTALEMRRMNAASICTGYPILSSLQRTEASHWRGRYLRHRVLKGRVDWRSRETRCDICWPGSKKTAANLVLCGCGISLNDRDSSGSRLVQSRYQATFWNTLRFNGRKRGIIGKTAIKRVSTSKFFSWAIYVVRSVVMIWLIFVRRWTTWKRTPFFTISFVKTMPTSTRHDGLKPKRNANRSFGNVFWSKIPINYCPAIMKISAMNGHCLWSLPTMMTSSSRSVIISNEWQ